MTYTKPRFLSFEEYLSYDDGTDNLYELFNGELIEVPPESGLNVEIANFIFSSLFSIVGHRRLRGHGLEIEVRGEPKNRYPDLTILQPEHVQLLRQRNTIRLSMVPPLLVVEVVSPGELQRDRDYIAKRMQYQDRGIPEYWIIDPQQETILVLALTDATYVEANTFKGDERVRSPQLGELTITATQIVAAG
ncbi:MAG: Uma2 family endonuclease [Leptolyngbyaceae cyanobacterium RM2_2_4]|nr:Uma2 family endonuclease [Leptolyngbyaceae cyanobacterium SM1_4_3]NJN90770.1 Uma2 family endonuclease [Leptolyngbyaceae cyanobacterium SL_5_14]NJO48815.1 Uma2 family endonuclease [Leptolyngbyaceae cyanobacterium RM2_2_4]